MTSPRDLLFRWLRIT